MIERDDTRQPEGWGTDSLTEVLKIAHENAYRTVNTLRVDVKQLRDAYDTYLLGLQALNRYHEDQIYFERGGHSYDLVVAFLHSSIVSIASTFILVASQQLVEANKTLRGCLETALYGYYLTAHPEKWEIWKSRPALLPSTSDIDAINEIRRKRKAVGAEFSASRILKELQSVDARLHRYAQSLYEQCIDWGAHYNISAMRTVASKSYAGDAAIIELAILGADREHVKVTLAKATEVALCSLRIFDVALRPIWNPAGISDRIASLSARRRK
jgi:hypothetical protein